MSRRRDLAALIAFCCAGALVAACSGNPSVTTSPGNFGGASNNGGTGTVANGGSAATGMLITDGGDGPGPGDVLDATSLEFDPPTITLTLDAGAVKSADYVLKATLKDKSQVDVTAESLEFDRPDWRASKSDPRRPSLRRARSRA